MRILVVGAGAVGGNFAVRLGRGGHAVQVLARGATAAAIARDGLTLRSGEESWTIRPRVAADPADVASPNLVLVVLKAPAIPAAAEAIRAAAGAAAPVIFAANGVPWWYGAGAEGPLAGWRSERLDPGGRLAAAIPAARVLGGVIYSANLLEAAGVVRNVSPTLNRLAIGAAAGGAAPQGLAEALSVGGLTVTAAPDIRRAVWEKLYVNLVFNPVAMLTGARFGAMLDDPGLRALGGAMLAEAMAVAAAAGIPSPPDLAARVLDPAQPGRDHKPSMLQDLEAGRPLELEAVLGAVVEMAGTLGIPAPTLRTVMALAAARAGA